MNHPSFPFLFLSFSWLQIYEVSDDLCLSKKHDDLTRFFFFFADREKIIRLMV